MHFLLLAPIFFRQDNIFLYNWIWLKEIHHQSLISAGVYFLCRSAGLVKIVAYAGCHLDKINHGLIVDRIIEDCLNPYLLQNMY